METTYQEVIHYEPKMCNRFIVEVPEEFGFNQWNIFKVNKPKFVNGDWANIRIDFNDLIPPYSVTEGLMKIIHLQKNTPHCDDLFCMAIKSLNALGETIEEWQIIVNSIVTVDFGDYSYADSDNCKPFLIVKPYDCKLKLK
jgi:hypothetical protein